MTADLTFPDMENQANHKKLYVSMNLFLFAVNGIFFAMDADQISDITPYHGEIDPNLHWFHQKLDYRIQEVNYVSPVVITLKTVTTPYRLVIDAMEDIAELNINDISLLPKLLEPWTHQTGIWGVFHRKNNLVLILDFEQLLQINKLAVAQTIAISN
ncbi:hypothetical protein GALL_481370 [mine drainage metagenome]|uniref:Chemotaxis protein CheW n=1 Tax=mine drainage metagenome TaxID=410659 RepID=A0A1J5PF44_9ZZZZ